MTNTKQLFEEIDLTLLDEFIVNRREEDLHLDFKLAQPRMTRDDRRNLAKALSGFANADGGIVVWGISARRNADGVDCAAGKNPISQLSLFISQLNEFTGEAVNPLADGVLHRKIEVTSDSGFAVTFVPASDSGPHMAKLGEDRYYKRSGSRFARMEHFDLEDMFGRRPRPVLEITYRIETGGRSTLSGISSEDVLVVISLANTGRGPAIAPYLEITAPRSYYVKRFGISATPHEIPILVTSLSREGNSISVAGTADFMIHPGTKYELAQVRATFGESLVVLPDLDLNCRIAAVNFAVTAKSLTIPVAELLKVIGK